MNFDTERAGFHRTENRTECGLIPATKHLLERMGLQNNTKVCESVGKTAVVLNLR